MWLLSMFICYAFVLHCLSRTTGEDNDIYQKSKAEEFNCSLCSSSFSRRDNLKRHIHYKHREIKTIHKKETDASFTYNICDGKFSRNDNLKRHMMRAHETVFKDERCIDVRTMCNFPKCTESFFRKVDFVKHLTDRHNIACSVESYTFASELEFQNWKEK